jgi:hypothetical protein
MDPRLHVIGAKHDDDQVDRRVGGQQSRQKARAIAVCAAQPVVEGGRAPVQALGNDVGTTAELGFQHAGPSVGQRMAALRGCIVAPRQGIAVAEDRFHRTPRPAWPLGFR